MLSSSPVGAVFLSKVTSFETCRREGKKSPCALAVISDFLLCLYILQANSISSEEYLLAVGDSIALRCTSSRRIGGSVAGSTRRLAVASSAFRDCSLSSSSLIFLSFRLICSSSPLRFFLLEASSSQNVSSAKKLQILSNHFW